MSDDWKPPGRKMTDGAVIFDGWRPIRDAVDAAYVALGREPVANIPTEEWNLVGLAIDYYRHANRATCVECGSKLWAHETIRCLDCKAPLCERCAPKHFWPNGQRQKAH